MKNTNTETPDAMPREVATEFLTNPRAKLSNTFRKTCNAARATVIPSQQTMIVKGEWLEPDGKSPITDATKLANRFKQVPIDRLHRIVTRCARRQRQAFNAGVKSKTDFVRNQLAEIYHRLQFVLEAAKTEIAYRAANKFAGKRRHPLWKKGVSYDTATV